MSHKKEDKSFAVRVRNRQQSEMRAEMESRIHYLEAWRNSADERRARDLETPGQPALPISDNKKVVALMVVIEKLIAQYLEKP